jgi:putative salt-induced outer membrane protein YdiY
MNHISYITGTCTAFLAASTALAADTNLWQSSVSLGFTLTKGNSDTVQGVAKWLTARKWDQNELRFGADGTYGEADGKTTAQVFHGFAQYNRLFSDRLFGYIRLDGYHDRIADIDYRFVLSPGMGYYFIKNERTLLSAEVGPGYILEKKGGRTDDYVTIRFAERFEQKLGEKARLWQSLEYLPQVDDWGNYILNGEIGVESPLSAALSLRAYIQDTFTSQPAEGRKENDVKLVTAVAYKF